MNRKHLYVVSTESGSIKVGITECMKHRLSSLRVVIDKTCKVEFVTEYVDNPLEVERLAHELLYGFNIAGEWFKCKPETAIDACKVAIVKRGVISDEQCAVEFVKREDQHLCKYRHCKKPIKQNGGSGRKRQFCNKNCRRMESYYSNKESKGDSNRITENKGGVLDDLAFIPKQ